MVPMPTRLPPLLDRALLFAHRGARAVDAEGAVASLTRALDAGATGIHGDVRASADGELVLSRDGVHRRFPRRRVEDVAAADLHPGTLRVADVLRAAGALPVSLHVHDPGVVPDLVALARGLGGVERLWLVHDDLEVLARLRDTAPGARLVNDTSLDRLPSGAERLAAELAAARIDAVRLPEPDWTGGLVTLFHRFEVLAFAAEAAYERQLVRLVDMGIDAITSDQVDRMVAVAELFA